MDDIYCYDYYSMVRYVRIVRSASRRGVGRWREAA